MENTMQLEFCKKCLNRKMDLHTGITCNLTGRKPDFETECPTFKLDESYIENLNDTDEVDHADVLIKLSDEQLQKFKLEQNFPKALTAGLIAGLLGALLWGIITVTTGYQIGYVAIAIGAGVGISMKIFGKGIDQIFGITGAIIAVLSCFLGNFLSIIGFLANTESLGYIETLTMIDFSQIIPIMTETFNPMDIVFYGIAGYEGYKFAFRTFTEKELEELQQ